MSFNASPSTVTRSSPSSMIFLHVVTGKTNGLRHYGKGWNAMLQIYALVFSVMSLLDLKGSWNLDVFNVSAREFDFRSQCVLLVLSYVYSKESQTCNADRHTPGQCLPGHIQLLHIWPFWVRKSTLAYKAMADIGPRLPKMARNHICVTTTAQSSSYVLVRSTCQEESSLLASHFTTRRWLW